ncbi:MAG: ArnT family glycosyltransferase [Myxococcota bacterium]
MPAGPELPNEPRARPVSLVVAVLCALLLTALFGSEGHSATRLLIGAGLVLGASFGLLDGLGFFEEPGEVSHQLSLGALVRPLTALVVAGAALVLSLRAAVAGTLPMPRLTSACLVTAASLACVVSLAWLVHRAAREPTQRAWWKREGLWLLVTGVVLYVPMLGNYSLYDPWETHYGEVAREMIVRDDWISFWWAQENWFWSKPALDFWLQGLSFLLLGVRYQPDEMLAGAADGYAPAPEWAVRAPVIVLTLIANYLVYKAVARLMGRRAGLFAGLALLLTPYWYFIAHQSMTDMPYVAPLTAGLCLVLLGLDQAPSARCASIAVRVGRREFHFSRASLVLELVVASVLPQVCYLLSRNVSIVGRGLSLHADHFMAGSGGGNCGLPGNDPCEAALPVLPELQPALLALLWAALLGVFLWINRDERRAQRWYFIAAWYFVALAALAKGAPGLVLPLVVSVTALLVTKRFRDLERLEWASLALIVACVTLPWYVQAFLRHGASFTDRLLFYDMYKRAFVHVHDTNAGDDVSFRYYIWQLGYGLFPWTGLALWGFLRSFGPADEAKSKTGGFFAFIGIWCLLGFAMFSVSLTKFHHYALPVAPPAAILAGLTLSELVGDPRENWCASTRSATPRALTNIASAFTCALATLLAALWLAGGSLLGAPTTTNIPAAAIAVCIAIASFIICLRTSPAAAPAPTLTASASASPLASASASASASPLASSSASASAPASASPSASPLPSASASAAPAPTWTSASPARSTDASDTFRSATQGLLALLSASLIVLIGRDLFTDGAVPGSARLINLFSYNYSRPWPDNLAFAPALRAVTLVTATFLALMLLPRLRPLAARVFLAVSFCFGAFALNIYMIAAAPHWGQRDTILTYYATRSGPEEPLVAYQLNWKGENFYTGNRLPAFVTTGQKFRDWISEQRALGVRVIYFTTEHSRLANLKQELGSIKTFQLLTHENLNNKFFLARVEL